MAKNQSLQCPLCQDQVEKLVYRFHVENEQEVIDRIKADHREWVEEDGVCTRCLDYYQIEGIRAKRILPEVGPYFSVKSVDDFIILPTSLRLDVEPRFTGKGITICLIDSGFYLHDDLIKTKNRVKAVIDITEPSRTTDYFLTPHPESWHGTMTSVVCAGDGFASNGLYKSIASEAELVLIKTQTTNEKDPYNGRITNQSIADAMRWVLAHHQEYDIRIVSISVGADLTESHDENEINRLAEELIKNDIVVVAAVGNDVNGQLKPPASAPKVITIGGLDDGNQLHASGLGLYHSAFGSTSEGYVKPELIANAIWIAAPILPNTLEKKEAEHLHALLGLTDYDLAKYVNQNAKKISKETGLSIGSKIEEANSFRQQIVSRIQQTKFFSADYMHVDGTSFAAPIVSSIIAQLLQSNPLLTPTEIRSILFQTATRLPNFDAARQGFGLVQPRKAVQQSVIFIPEAKLNQTPFVNRTENRVEFYIRYNDANHIALAGDFNGWGHDTIPLDHVGNGIWKTQIPNLPNGIYRYKFVIDGHSWIEDVSNPFRELDNFNGFNSLLKIE